MSGLTLFSLSWILAVLAFMAWWAKPLHLWSVWSAISALGFFCVFGLWGCRIGPFIASLVPEFFDAVADGYRKATKGRELDEAELE